MEERWALGTQTLGTRPTEKVPRSGGGFSRYLAKRMKRQPKLTKREKKALSPKPAAAGQHQHQHIHCIACGRHLDAGEFDPPATATIITCDHGSNFPSCVKCMAQSIALVKEHDRTNRPVQTTPAWH